ncbi:conserved hypothetical protein [Rhodopseudomonas palustris HaA2]|uniref:Nucleoside 2-deoxyribosyltransferase n=1 Tax=Rhodopseudomonas palustris (strain HaA2) TaxID=316058 RepID=Q2IUD5_RHOP2|nr:conserved hypothetical protein [Rhodopseudomonas palustris HaA2]
MKNRPTIYFAAPLFNDRERAFNTKVAHELERYAEVFLPQRDGELLSELIQNGMTASLAERRIFRADALAMRNSDLLVAILDGAHIDEAVAFEIGFACGLNCCCVGLQTDTRRALPSGNNPMIGQSLHRIFPELEALYDWVTCWSAEWFATNLRSTA